MPSLKNVDQFKTVIEQLERQLAIEDAVEALGVERWWRNTYECHYCPNDWTDDCTSRCDGKCLGCGRELSPIVSVPLDRKGGRPL